jgi:hypothetical protein
LRGEAAALGSHRYSDTAKQDFSKNLLVGFDTSDDAMSLRSPTIWPSFRPSIFSHRWHPSLHFLTHRGEQLSNDVYAMGVPLTALSVTCYPRDEDGVNVLGVMRGGMEAMLKKKW